MERRAAQHFFRAALPRRPAPKGEGRNGRQVLPLPVSTTDRTGAMRRKAHRVREAANRQRRAAEARQSIFGYSCAVRSSWPHRAQEPASERMQRARSPRHNSGGKPSDLIRRSVSRVALAPCARGPPRSKRWCQRRCDSGRLDTGSGRPPQTRPSKEGAETSIVSTPPGVENAHRRRLQATRACNGSTASRRERGFRRRTE